MDFGWDRDGDILAIISLNSTTLFLWDSNTHRKHHLDCGLRDPLSCVLWSKNGHTLAVATAKGNVCIYNHSTSRFVIIIVQIYRLENIIDCYNISNSCLL